MPPMKRRGTSENYRPMIAMIAPVVIAILVIILILNYLFGKTATETTSNGDFVTIVPAAAASEIYVHLNRGNAFLITDERRMFTTDEKVEVRAGEAQLKFEGDDAKVLVDRLGEVSYAGLSGGQHVLAIGNGYIWIETTSHAIETRLKNFTVIVSSGSVAVMNQNTIASNVYVLRGTAKASVSGMDTMIGVGQKLTLLSTDIKNLTKLSDTIEPIDDFFRTTEWFIKNHGDQILASGSGGMSLSMISSGVSLSWSWRLSLSGTSMNRTSQLLAFSSPIDESAIADTKVDIAGDILSANVIKVTVNDRETSLDSVARTFVYKAFPLSNGINNLVYKTYGSGDILLSKSVISVYASNNGKKDLTTDNSTKKPTVTTYPISDKDFRILSPGENPYKTTDTNVKINGQVNAGIVEYITVNDFRLTKFTPKGTSWSYFANEISGNLNDGINLYTIKYFGTEGKLLYTQLYTIVKTSPAPITDISTGVILPKTPATSSGTPKPNKSEG